MNKIKVLSDEIANRIAAGEVIERPASIVKECVENSIDAGANEIIVKINNGGRDFIQIIDNGHGMSEEDAFLAFERHATSKISTADDIVHISTMGFRGEALPSISSISIFQIITKTADDEMATELNFKGGKLDTVMKTSANNGTTITVKNIFYNVPARRKFLKTEPVEYKHILNYLHYQSVLFPNIRFVFFSNGKEKFNYPATNTIEERMLDIFGTVFKNQNFIYFKKEAQLIKISGYLEDVSFSNKGNMLDTHYIFVNRRYINDKIIYSAIKNAYDPFIKKYKTFEGGKLPNYILFIDINPEEIDVNVHPAKTEIRFRNNTAVYNFVRESVYESLFDARNEEFGFNMINPERDNRRMENGKWRMENEPVATISGCHNSRSGGVTLRPIPNSVAAEFTSVPPSVAELASVPSSSMPADNKPTGNDLQNLYAALEIKNQKSNYADLTLLPTEKISHHNALSNHILSTIREDYIPLWQLHNTYIFIQIPDGFVAIDQHAAHERILFEKLLKNIDNNKPNSQKLVFPLVIDLPNYLSENTKTIIDENNEILYNLGFTVKSFSGNSIVIDEIPSELGFWDGGNVFIDILKQLQEEITNIKDFRIASAMSVACKASVKAGKKLTKREMHELIEELFKCDFPFQCPHGRPLIIKLTLNDLEKMFKRIE